MKRVIPVVRAEHRQKAFTLVEVVIALAVTTFCIIVLLGLLPVAVSTAQKSRSETRASYLAEQVVSDLRSTSFTNANIVCLSSGTLTSLPSFSLANASTNCLQCDGVNNVLATATTGQYTSGVTGTSTDYLVQVTVAPTSITNLSSVYVEVSAPAQAALGARSRFSFQTMIGNRQ